jgi:hypothetical protein
MQQISTRLPQLKKIDGQPIVGGADDEEEQT